MNKRYAPLLLVTIFALILSALMPFYAIYQPISEENKEIASLFGDKMLICTPSGFKWVDINEQQPSQHSQQYQCPVCFMSDHQQGVLPSSIIASHVDYLYQQAFFAIITRYENNISLLATIPRGPPSLPSWG